MPSYTDIMGCGLSLSGCLPVDGAVPGVPHYRRLAASSSTTLVHLFVFCFCFYEPTSGHRRAISMPESRRWTACHRCVLPVSFPAFTAAYDTLRTTMGTRVAPVSTPHMHVCARGVILENGQLNEGKFKYFTSVFSPCLSLRFLSQEVQR